jgi:epoxyqueuosine reductase
MGMALSGKPMAPRAQPSAAGVKGRTIGGGADEASPRWQAQDPRPSADHAVREAIRAQALAQGFDAVGFAPAQLGAAARADLQEFIARGYHGDMGWLAASAERRGDPQILWPEARTVVVLGVNYAPAADPLGQPTAPAHGVVSVYARGRDYHETLKRRLRALAQWIERRWPGALKLFVDTAPVMEKPLAQRAGLGWQGKHTNLVSRNFGSWLFLGEIYLSLELSPDPPQHDHCGSCRRCLDACPTNAFPAPYRLDARRCISYLTIEHKGMIPLELRPLIGNRIYGCDDCLAVCPWNKFARAAHEADFAPREALTAPRLAALAGLDDAGFRRLFSGSPIKRTGRDRFVRNVLIAIGNAGAENAAPELLAAVLHGLDDPAPLVRASAVWALSRLSPPRFRAERDGRLGGEDDPLVVADWRREPRLD